MNTELSNETYKNLDTWSFEESIGAIIASNARAVEAVQKALPELSKAAQGIKERLLLGGRLVYIGAGTSGRLAVQDAAELPPTFSFENTLCLLAGGSAASGKASEASEDDQEAARQQIQEANITDKDAVIGVAASGSTPYTVAGLLQAKAQGAFSVGIANNPDTPLLTKADIGIFLDTGAEVLAGSTRLAAGTAQKIALNALSTSVLVSLGGAYQNLMVGMKASNHKLQGRAVSIVARGANVSETKAKEALHLANGQMREAIFMLKTGLDLAESQSVLKNHKNKVQDALDALKGQP